MKDNRSIKFINRIKRSKRVRAKLFGTAAKPRAAVYRSLKHIYLQLIDDSSGKTLVGVSDLHLGKKATALSGIAQAQAVGTLAAEKAKAAKVSRIIFDRRGYKYHGRVKALAEAMRKVGLQF